MVGKIQIIVARKRQVSAALAENPKAILAQALGKRASQGGALEFRQFDLREIIQGPHQHLALVGVALAPTPWGAIEPRFAIGLGCAIKFARQFVYAKRPDLTALGASAIGSGLVP